MSGILWSESASTGAVPLAPQWTIDGEPVEFFYRSGEEEVEDLLRYRRRFSGRLGASQVGPRTHARSWRLETVQSTPREETLDLFRKLAAPGSVSLAGEFVGDEIDVVAQDIEVSERALGRVVLRFRLVEVA
jgi:hypothetical protein